MRTKLLMLSASLFFANLLSAQVLPTGRLSRASTTMPISFVENQGQVDPQVRFLAHTGSSTVFLTSNEVVLGLYSLDQRKHAAVSAVHLKWNGPHSNAEILAEEPLPGKINYLIGRDPSRWHTNLPTFARVRYRALFPGVDAVFYGKEGEMEYDLVVAPGADVRKINFAFEDARSIHLAVNGDLVLQLKSGEVRQRRPRVYQEMDGKRRLLPARYLIHRDKTIGYEIAGVDHARELVIDPTLAYSTYIGSSTADSVNSVAVDQFGRAYATGSTVFGFPTKNPAQGNQLGTDAFVTKFFATGGGLIYSTILGGSSEDIGHAIAVDRLGSAYVAGQTDSTDFPVTAGAFQTTPTSGGDGFVTKLSPSGSSFVYSTLLGGVEVDAIFALALDSDHRAYVTGVTCSPDFPVKNAFQPVYNSQNCADGGVSAFVTRLNAAGTALDYSTFLDGTIASFGEGIAVDSTFHAYVTGFTESSDFPTTAGAFQRTFKAAIIPSFPNDIIGDNGFVTKFAADGQSLVYSTFLGGSASDEARAIAVDGSGRAYVTGTATSKDFPVTSGAFQKTLRGGSDAFVTKFQITGSGLFYSTFLGGSGGDGGNSIAVDSFGRAHVAGSTTSTDFPLLGAIQSHFGGTRDAFVTKLSGTGGVLFYSTYLGGSAADDANSVRLDSAGNAYVGGSTSSSNFPTTRGAFSRTLKGSTDGWVAKVAP
jgi:beta-propeller repeat-containing protein